MEGLNTQPDLHDLLRVEDDVVSPTSMDLSPERPLNSLNNSASKINTPAKLLMVGEPILVKTDQSEITGTSKELSGNGDGKIDTSGSSAEEFNDRINTPSPDTAAAMESFIAEDDLTAASPKLDVSTKPPTPVSFTTSAPSKVLVAPQTSILNTVKLQQPISIAAKKIMVASQPVQVVRRDGSGGGPVFTKYVVKRSTTANAAVQKSPVVFTKTKGLHASPSKANNFKSGGSIMLSPIKGGFKIPISPIKSPIKVSVIPPTNTGKKIPALGKQIRIPIQTSLPPQQKVQSSPNTLSMVNGVISSQGSRSFMTQQPITLQNRQITINTNPTQVNNNQRQVVQQLNVISNATSIQDNQNMKNLFLQLQFPQNDTLQPGGSLRSNQGHPITFTSMAQLNGGNLSLNQSGNTIAFMSPSLSKIQPQQSPVIQRKTQTVKVAIPNQTTQQVKTQRLIMPATSLNSSRSIIPANTPSVAGNIGYAMVPAKYVEQLQKRIISQNTFTAETSPVSQVPKLLPGKIGANGKMKKPCNCTKSQCLKLYCECFANGQFCDDCNCVNCYNNLEHEAERSKAVKQCLERNPAAFRPKIGRGKDDNRTHSKGCNCKRSGCLKNYCECYEARIPCTSKCKCIGCKNYEETNDRRSLMSLADAADFRVQQQTAAKTKLSNQIGEMRTTARTSQTGERLPYTFFTQEVIEATCTCLLAQAEEAEKTNRPMVVAEAMILEEFGRCVMQIIQSAGKAKVLHFN